MNQSVGEVLSGRVAAIMTDASRRAIMPRFRRLDATDVSEKSPGEVVTIADREAEQILTQGLGKLIPGARVVGEEACADNPNLLDDLDQGVVWIVDPLDGTANFAAGREPFGMIVALARDGIVVGGWIYQPVPDTLFHAELGVGAFVTRNGVINAVRVPKLTGHPVAALATQFMESDMRSRVSAAAARKFELQPIPRCAAEHYPRLCRGENHVAIFQRTLPWDHAAGALLFNEAGGTVVRWDGSPYVFHDDGVGIIAVCQRELWSDVADLVSGVSLNASA